eukprot:3155411-Heterocapsa_arctica.AAC.1
MGVAVQEGQFLQHLLEEIGHSAPLRVHSDSSAARAIVAQRGVGRLKHLAVRELWLQDELRAGHLQGRARTTRTCSPSSSTLRATTS